jgi:putative cell wall-binding protein
VNVVFVATGADFPDALAGAAIAGKLGAPLLLTASSYLPSETRDEILRLGPSSIVLLGGRAVIDGEVENQLKSLAPVTRLHGDDRYGTAVAVSKHGFPTNGSASVVYIATGTSFADALTSAPAAAARNGPVLLTLPGSLPQITRNEIIRLSPNQIVILGGTAAVSTAVENQLKGLSSNTIRVQGVDRYATAVAISKHAFPGSSPSVPAVFVTIGTDFPDALAGAAAAAAIGAPVILSPPVSMDLTVASEIGRVAPTSDTLVVLGGTHVFSVGLHHAFLNLL